MITVNPPTAAAVQVATSATTFVTPASLRLRLASAQNLAPDDAATEAIAVALDAKAAAEDAAKPYADVNAEARRVLDGIMAETGQTTYKTPAGEAYVPAPSTRITYDARALDALCASSPELARVLAPHRKETSVPGSLTIRAGRAGGAS